MFRKISRIPYPVDYMNCVLRSTQRKTPTLVHKRWAIPRIRQFYIRKIKITAVKLCEQFSQIIAQFPILDEMHPFYSDLLNVLYDARHYRIALGQVANSRNLIEKVERDYIRLLNHTDTFYGCKELKKAALGRMCSVIRTMHISLIFLELVRQHMSRLPAVDPNMRTFIVCGSPNVGKSTFISKVTRAAVEVHSSAFTTKTLFVGHMEYHDMCWQIIDTPGLLDRPFEHRNSIEMQTITALAHVGACSLFIVDISESCGYSLNRQADLFESLKQLLRKKPMIVICNKIDLVTPTELADEKKAIILRMVADAYRFFKHDLTLSSLSEMGLLLAMSTLSEEGLTQVIRSVCDILLQSLVEAKLKSRKSHKILEHVQPIKKPEKAIETRLFIPHSLVKLREQKNDGIRNIVYTNPREQMSTEKKNSTIIPEIFAGYTLFDVMNMGLAKNLSRIEDEENKIYKKWNHI